MIGNGNNILTKEQQGLCRASSVPSFGGLFKFTILPMISAPSISVSECVVPTISLAGARPAFQSGITQAATYSRRPVQAGKILEFHPRTSFIAQQPKTFIHQSFVPGILSLPSSSYTQKNFSSTTPVNMPRGVKKENLPSKICVTCGRPFTWRKKWEKVWNEVTTCSKSCNHKRQLSNRGGAALKDLVDATATDRTSNEERNGYDDDAINTDKDTAAKKESRRVFEKNGEDYGDREVTEALSAIDLLTNGNCGEGSDFDDDSVVSIEDENSVDPVTRAKVERKAAKKAKKAERRAQREGRGDPTAGQKHCDMCSRSVDLLIRCMHKESPIEWSMVCGKCWKVASGGVVDGDENHPHYRYGGLWKNRRAQS